MELVRTVPPGAHSDLEAFVRRDGTRAMTGGPLDFAGHALAGVSAVAFDATVVEGQACAGRRISTADDGALMECASGTWRIAGGTAGGMPCSWSGWLIVNVINWSAPDVNPPYISGSVLAWRCENDRVVETTVTGCRSRRSVVPGRRSPTFTLAQCGLDDD